MIVYLTIAEMSLPVETIFVVSLGVGFFFFFFGVGGGFLTTPFLIFFGVPPAIAVGSQAVQFVATSMSGVLGHWSRGNVDMKMGSVMMAGGLAGSFVGVFVFKLLEHIGQIDFAISLLYIVLLGSIGFLMLFESAAALLGQAKGVRSAFNEQRVSPFIAALPYKMRFPRSKLYISALVPVGIGFFGGLLASILGIGGGFVLVPAMIYILGMPSLLVTGTSLFQMVFTTGFAAIMHALANHTVDIMLALILIFGGVIGTQMGFLFSRFISGNVARLTLALIVLAVCFQMIGQLFIQPQALYSLTIDWSAGG